MYPTPNELSSYSPAWPCAHFRLAGGVNALAGVLLLNYPVNFPFGKKPEYPEKTHDF